MFWTGAGALLDAVVLLGSDNWMRPNDCTIGSGLGASFFFACGAAVAAAVSFGRCSNAVGVSSCGVRRGTAEDCTAFLVPALPRPRPAVVPPLPLPLPLVLVDATLAAAAGRFMI